MKNLFRWVIVFSLVTVFVVPLSVEAQMNRITAAFDAKNLTAGGNWVLPVSVKNEDVIRYRLKITNNDLGGLTARDVVVQIRIPDANLKLTMNPFSYVFSSIGGANSQTAFTQVNGSGHYSLEYIPGTSKVTVSGQTRSLYPDTKTANLTLNKVSAGEVPAGEENSAYVEFDAKVKEISIVRQAGDAPTPTPKLITTSTGGVAAATGSAVAKVSPQTGFMDPVIMNTLKWAGVGMAGFGMRIWANRVRRKADEKWSR